MTTPRRDVRVRDVRRRRTAVPWELSTQGGVPVDRLACVMLAQVSVVHLRVRFAGMASTATLAMIRGVWGKELRKIDPNASIPLFEGEGPEDVKQPRYVFLNLSLEEGGCGSFDLLLINPDVSEVRISVQALGEVARSGLGPKRKPFAIHVVEALGPDGLVRSRDESPSWSLGRSMDAIDPAIGLLPCTIDVLTPTHLVKAKEDVKAPTFADVVASGARRLGRFLPPALAESWALVSDGLVGHAKARGATWIGQTTKFKRWSARQAQEMYIPSVIGRFELAEGLHATWPVLQALTHVSLGKGAAFGMGNIRLTWRRM